MSPDLELKGKSEAALEVLVGKENVPASPFSEKKVLQPGTDCKGNAYGMEASPIEQTPLSSGNEDVEVNITGCTNSGKALMMEVACEDVTECSSSFGDTVSGTENGSAFSEDEVESRMYASYASSSICDVWCEPALVRQKKLTIHWRRFIRPLMWRCKWIELQLKQLKSQAFKYDKELAAYDYRKQHEFANFTLDGLDTKSVPLSGQIHRNKVMKRKKRKRVEETCNLASYMSNHSVFSYFDNRDHADGACLEDVRGVAIDNADHNEEFKLNDMLSSVDCKDSDKSLEDIIQKIEAVHSQVHKLRTRIDKVVSENSGKFCSVNNLSMLGASDGLNFSDLNSASLAGNKNTFSVRSVHASSQLKSENSLGDLLMAGNAMSSCQEITPLIEITDRPQFEVLWEDTKDKVLTHNQAVKEELHDLENVRNQLVEKESVEEQKSISLSQVSEPDLVTVNAAPNVRLTVKAYSASKSNAPRSTRRARQKSGSKSCLTKDKVLIHNQPAMEELHDVQNIRNQLKEKTKDSVEEQKSISLSQVSEPDLVTENAAPNVQSTVKAWSASKSNVPRSTRRARRKSGSKRWSRRSSG